MLQQTMMHGSQTRLRPEPRRAFSLIELLVCVVIIAILSTISINCYWGAIEQTELKWVVPSLVSRLEGLRKEAVENEIVITVEFKMKESAFTVTRRKGDVTKAEEIPFNHDEQEGILRRRLCFTKYEWPDGSSTPPTFTFPGKSAPQAGKVHYGTSRAEAAIWVADGRLYSPMMYR